MLISCSTAVYTQNDVRVHTYLLYIHVEGATHSAIHCSLRAPSHQLFNSLGPTKKTTAKQSRNHVLTNV